MARLVKREILQSNMVLVGDVRERCYVELNSGVRGGVRGGVQVVRGL
jgi:hypothetical protein